MDAKLTKFVKAAGWAAKLGQADLNIALGGLKNDDKNLLVGLDSSDDASIYKINDDISLVQTVDFITPVVDDPFVYGQIAAANSLSDIFAMGAEVKTALNIVGFDGCNHTKDVLKEILDGGYNKVKECGGIIVGGHTIETPEMVYGLSVTGIVNNKYYQNNTVRQNDILILTKPIGMGVLTTAIKADMLEKSSIKNISDILAQLNYKASTIFKKYDVSAVTDVTGFGLAGHSYEMVKNTNFSIEFDLDNIPFLKDAIDMANMGIIPAGTYNNKSYLNNKVINLTNNDDILFYDAQTSGGLLIAVSQNDALNLVKELQNEGYEYSAIIGTITKEKENKIYLK